MNHQQLILELSKHMAATNASQNDVAAACGISSSTLSYWRRGQYSGNSDEVAIKVSDYLDNARKREAIKNPDTLTHTTIYNAVQQFCSIVSAHGIMGVITGDAGIGKTTALKAFALEHPTCILIEADHGYTANALFKDLCRRLKITPQGSLHDKLEQVVGELKGTGRLVIVDEAEHFNYRTLELIRRVFDKAGVGIGLVGMPRLIEKLRGESMYYAQIYSRICAARKLGLLKDKDIYAVLNNEYKSVDPQAFTAVLQSCKRNMRLLSNLLRWCSEIMLKNNLETLTPDVVRSAANMLAVAA